MRRFVLILAVALLVSTPGHAMARSGGYGPEFLDVHVANTTRYDTWVDVSTAENPLQAWAIQKSLCLHPGDKYFGHFGIKDKGGYQMRVRGYIKGTGGCNTQASRVEVYVEQSVAFHHNVFWLTVLEHGTLDKFGLRLDKVI